MKKPAPKAIGKAHPEALPDDSTPTKDFEAPALTPPERRKAFVEPPDDKPKAIALDAGGTPCIVCGTIGAGVCPVDGHARGMPCR